MEEVLKYLKLMQGILGTAATLGDAIDWIGVEENAQRLRDEDHENDPE